MCTIIAYLFLHEIIDLGLTVRINIDRVMIGYDAGL
jgi:hypothetical protein